MTNKPQNEGENRKPSRLRFFLRLLLSVLVVGYCVFLNFHRCSLTAYADQSWDTRILTPQETIGLYGNRFQITYTGINNIDQFFPCELVGSWDTPSYWPTLSSDYRLFPPGPGGSWDYTYFNPLWFSPSLPNENIALWSGSDYLNRSTFLIYRVYFGSLFQSHTSAAHPNITIELSFNYPVDCINWSQMILFSRDPAAVDRGLSWCQHTFTLAANPITQMVGSRDSSGRGQSVVTPFPQYVDSETGVNMGMISMELGSLLASETWRYSKQTLYLNGCDVYESLTEGQSFLLYVQCPQITSNYFPPIPTTTEPPPQTTRADFTTPIFTYDLSPLETNQQNQIRIQNEDLQIQYAQLQGINYICWKLDQIYNEMVERGEIPVNFLPGDDFSIPTNIKNFVGDQLTTYTMASMDFTNVYRPFTSFMGIFDGYNWLDSFAVLGGFSLAFGVFCWFVFRGRGGGA